MEACYINTISKNAKDYITAFSSIIHLRDYVNLQHEKFEVNIDSFFNKIVLGKLEINTNKYSTSYELETKNSLEKEDKYIINGNSEIFYNHYFQEINVSDLHQRHNHFVLSSIITNAYLTRLFNNIQLGSNENILNTYIFEIFGKEFEKFIMIDKKPLVSSNNQWIPLSNFGDGIKRFITIICAMYSSKDGYLYLDEIENGIHYTNLDKLWEIILTISKEQNVQVFATTHSKECIESYARVAKKLEDEEITFIELGRNKKDELKAMVYPYEWFIDEIEQNHEVRGW
jgi:AAA15 family ATPase/GTPase